MQVEDFQIDGDKITEEQLNALYIYLSMTFDSMKDEEKNMWYQIMQKIDKENPTKIWKQKKEGMKLTKTQTKLHDSSSSS